MKIDPCLTPSGKQKTNSKWTRDLNTQPETARGKIRKTFDDSGTGKCPPE